MARFLSPLKLVVCGLAALPPAVFSGRAAGDEALSFVAPASRATPSSVIISEPPATEAAAASAAPVAEPFVEGVFDLADLAAFAQAAAEEIAGAPVDDATRPFRPITQVTIDAALPPGLLPGDPGTNLAGEHPLDQPQFGDARLWGGWADVDFQWAATALCHRPLYFEQVNVERYGYTVSPVLQPAISGAHFFLTIPMLPYKVVAQPPHECIYTLGYYRAGSRVPRRWHHVNWDPTAATVEGFVATGLVFLIP